MVGEERVGKAIPFYRYARIEVGDFHILPYKPRERRKRDTTRPKCLNRDPRVKWIFAPSRDLREILSVVSLETPRFIAEG
jgi:hypothetical protein